MFQWVYTTHESVLLLIRGQEKSADTDSVWDGLGVRNPSIDLAMRPMHGCYAKIAFDRVIGESGKNESRNGERFVGAAIDSQGSQAMT